MTIKAPVTIEGPHYDDGGGQYWAMLDADGKVVFDGEFGVGQSTMLALAEAINRPHDVDGERYRWLKKMHDAGDEQWFVYGAHTDDLDAEIDAMLQSNSPGKDRP